MKVFKLIIAFIFLASPCQLQSQEIKPTEVKHINEVDNTGAIVRGDRSTKNLHLMFSGHNYGEGADIILVVLKKHQIKASFFLTGDFYRNSDFTDFIHTAKQDGHYLGAHSDKHLLYNDWTAEKTLLVSEEEFKQDLLGNYNEMKKFGILKGDSPYFMPPFEWNDETITQWADQLEIKLLNYSQGTKSHADYTLPKDLNYISSDDIYNTILEYESEQGLNGFLLLSHLGSGPDRKDKFYDKLDALIIELKSRGYEFTDLESTISPVKRY